MPVLPGMKCRNCRRTMFCVVAGKRQRLLPEQGGCNCPPVSERPEGWKPDVFTGEHPPDGVHHVAVPKPTIKELLKGKRPKE